MIKDTETTFKYVKLEQDFLNEVFMAGSDNKVTVEQGFKHCHNKVKNIELQLYNSETRVVFSCYLKNNFEVYDAYDKNIDIDSTKIFQNGMVKVLAKTNQILASRYITDLRFYHENQISNRIKELVDLAEEQE